MNQESRVDSGLVLRWATTFVLAAAGILGSMYGYIWIEQSRRREDIALTSVASTEPIQLSAVSALGRLEPQSEIVTLSAPSSLDGTTTRIETLLTREGIWVQAGQTVAVLDSHGRRQAALAQAEAAVESARAELDKVKAGAVSGELEAQKATILRLEAELRNAQSEYQRFDSLFQSGAISASESDQKKLIMETAEAQLAEAQSALDGLAEVRPVDVAIAQAHLREALSAVNQATAELDMTYVKAPLSGQVLNILSQPGEIIGNNGILEIGETNQMIAVAEVYETDIGLIEIGQEAVITSGATDRKLTGVVSEIGLQVNRQETFNTDPTVNTDNRIVKVTIRLDAESSEQVRNLSNLQVQVVIQV